MQEFPRLQRLTEQIECFQEETNFTPGLAALPGRLKRRSLVTLLTDFVDSITTKLIVNNFQSLASRHVVNFATLQDPDLYKTIEARPQSLQDTN